MTCVVVGLGACGPEADVFLRKAMTQLAHHPAWRVLHSSRVYRNPAWGAPLPFDFRNAAMLLEAHGSPAGVLRNLLTIENRLGRVRSIRYGKRSLDLDLLWSEGQPVASDFLTLPHPRLTQRAFALVPLIEVLDQAQIAVPLEYRRAAAQTRRQERLFLHSLSLSTDFAGAVEH